MSLKKRKIEKKSLISKEQKDCFKLTNWRISYFHINNYSCMYKILIDNWIFDDADFFFFFFF